MPGMDLGLSGRACIVTGASSGIGAATARALCAEGAKVLLVGRRGPALEAVAEAARGEAGEAAPLAQDVTDPAAGERIADACVQRFGECYGLVNGAGTSAIRGLDELTDDDWQAQWELHVLASLRLMRAAAGRMEERGGGRIVNVCSSSGKRPSSTNAAYSVTKAAAAVAVPRVRRRLRAPRRAGERDRARGWWRRRCGRLPAGSPTRPPSARASTASRRWRRRASGSRSGAWARPRRSRRWSCSCCSARASNVTGAAWSVDGGTFQSII